MLFVTTVLVAVTVFVAPGCVAKESKDESANEHRNLDAGFRVQGLEMRTNKKLLGMRKRVVRTIIVALGTNTIFSTQDLAPKTPVQIRSAVSGVCMGSSRQVAEQPEVQVNAFGDT